MKNVYFVLMLALLTSCQGNSESTESKEATIDMNGPELEVNVLNFNIENNTTEIELINRLDEDINKISGRINFFDANGAEITFATGQSKSSPFNQNKNPEIVKSKSKTTLTLNNKIPTETVSIKIIEFKATTKSGKEVKID
jgi:hypothetical protein